MTPPVSGQVVVGAVDRAWSRLIGAEPPIRPEPDEARSWLRTELVDPVYHQENLLQRVIDAINRLFDRGLEAARAAPPLSVLAAIVVFVALAMTAMWLISRTSRAATVSRAERPVISDQRVTAAQWRARASQAFADRRWSDAAVDGFRAVVVAAVEEGRLPDSPTATAHEVGDSLAERADDDRARRLRAAARIFDEVLYGDHPATEEQARSILDLDRARSR